jgi:hypothetical protein
MESIEADPNALRERGLKALVDALGWAGAVRFLRQLGPGTGNYARERDAFLPDWEAEVLVRKAEELASRR